MSDRARLDDLFDRALDLEPAERAAFLDREAAGVEERAAVARLLAAAEQELAAPPTPVALWREMVGQVPAAQLAPSTRLGAYRVVSELGRGGMAVVYLAERADGHFEQRVALKILERSAHDELAASRFHLERQILATLDHPNIARVFDGGIAPDGRPYFVMELVDGMPIDRYCDERELPLARRLELFAVVGRAVAAAHRRLVVHRDLKPSNILVSKEGQVKLLDFGIAKLIEDDAEIEAPVALTRASTLLLTPEYASPEQLAGQPVSTASDVYQLGLLLYELLVGRRAFPAPAAGGRPTSQLDREATPPSVAVLEAAAGNGLARARRRGCASPAQLGRQLRGDLDTLVAAALRPEPERRYESVSKLVEDVEHYLAGRPISARAESLLYRGRKLVARHRWLVTVVAAALAVVVALSVFYAVRLARERDLARQEAEKARQVAAFLTELFRGPDPFANKGAGSVTALELVDRGAATLEHRLEGQPEVKAALLHTLASVYRALVQPERAESLIGRALELRRQELGEEAPETLDSLTEQALIAHEADRSTAALALLGEALAGRERTLGPEHPSVASTLLLVSLVEHRQQRFAEALQSASRARSILDRQHPGDPAQLWAAHRAMALALGSLNRGPEALEHFAEAVRQLRALDPEHPELGSVLSEQAVELWLGGRLEEARPVFAESVRLMETVFGSASPRVEIVRLNAALAEMEVGRAAEALAMLALSVPRLEQALGPRHFRVGLARHYLGAALGEVGRGEEGLVEVEQARAILVGAFGEGSPDVIRCDLERVTLLARLGRLREAGELLAGVRSRVEADPALPRELSLELREHEKGLREAG